MSNKHVVLKFPLPEGMTQESVSELFNGLLMSYLRHYDEPLTLVSAMVGKCIDDAAGNDDLCRQYLARAGLETPKQRTQVVDALRKRNKQVARFLVALINDPNIVQVTE